MNKKLILLTVLVFILTWTLYYFFVLREEDKTQDETNIESTEPAGTESPQETTEGVSTTEESITNEPATEAPLENDTTEETTQIPVVIERNDDLNDIYAKHFKGSRVLAEHEYTAYLTTMDGLIASGDFVGAILAIEGVFKEYKCPDYDITKLASRYFDASYVTHVNSMEIEYIEPLYKFVVNNDIFATSLINSRTDIQINFLVDENSLIVQRFDEVEPIYIGEVEPTDDEKAKFLNTYTEATLNKYAYTFGDDVINAIVLTDKGERYLWGFYFESPTPKEILTTKKDW